MSQHIASRLGASHTHRRAAPEPSAPSPPHTAPGPRRSAQNPRQGSAMHTSLTLDRAAANGAAATQSPTAAWGNPAVHAARRVSRAPRHSGQLDGQPAVRGHGMVAGGHGSGRHPAMPGCHSRGRSSTACATCIQTGHCCRKQPLRLAHTLRLLKGLASSTRQSGHGRRHLFPHEHICVQQPRIS